MKLLNINAGFDTVDHEILLCHLDATYIIRYSVHIWIASYLSDGTQKLHVNGYISPDLPLKYGVPQGSILGQLLFVSWIIT